VQASGTKGARVDVVGTTDTVGKAITLQFVQDLNQIGYHASPKLLSNAIQYPYIQDSRNHVQVGYSQWYQDYPAASDFLNVLLSCGSFHPGSDSSINIAGFCDKDIDAQMAQALTLEQSNMDDANRKWGEIDHAIMMKSPVVPVLHPKIIDFVSKRVGNYQFSKQFYMLVGQLWVQ